MGQFSSPLQIEEIGYERWKIIQPFEYLSDSGLVVDVPLGFETDLASVPQLLRSFVPQIGCWSQAAVCHDLLYYRHRNGLDNAITRLQADRILLEGCQDKERAYNVSESQRRAYTIYHAVRIGSELSWLTNEENQTKLLHAQQNESFLDQ